MGKYLLSNDSKFVHEITFASSQDVKVCTWDPLQGIDQIVFEIMSCS